MNEWASPWEESEPRISPDRSQSYANHEAETDNNQLEVTGPRPQHVPSLGFLTGYADDAAWGVEEEQVVERALPEQAKQVSQDRNDEETKLPVFQQGTDALVDNDLWRRSPDREDLGYDNTAATFSRHDLVTGINGITTKEVVGQTGVDLLDDLEPWSVDKDGGALHTVQQYNGIGGAYVDLLDGDGDLHSTTAHAPVLRSGKSSTMIFDSQTSEDPMNGNFDAEKDSTREAEHEITSRVLIEESSLTANAIDHNLISPPVPQDQQEHGQQSSLTESSDDTSVVMDDKQFSLPTSEPEMEEAEDLERMSPTTAGESSPEAVEYGTSGAEELENSENHRPDAPNDYTEFGQFEESLGVDGTESLPESAIIHQDKSNSIPYDNIMVEKEPSNTQPELEIFPERVESTGQQAHFVAQDSMPSRLGFVLDKSLIYQLFPPQSNISHTSDVVPELIDSTSQRKAWHRVSRQSSMRYYNSSDFDNYVRVTWQGSAVRSKVTDIVAKWIADDRTTGGAVFRARIKSSKKAPKHDKESSKIIKEAANESPRQSVTSIKPIPSPKGFGWNTSTPQAQAQALFPPPLRPNTETGVSKRASSVASSMRSQVSSGLATSHEATQGATSVSRGDANPNTASIEFKDIMSADEDDDFGNFVSSDVPPVAPSVNMDKPIAVPEGILPPRGSDKPSLMPIPKQDDMLFDFAMAVEPSTPVTMRETPSCNRLGTPVLPQSGNNDLTDFDDWFSSPPPPQSQAITDASAPILSNAGFIPDTETYEDTNVLKDETGLSSPNFHSTVTQGAREDDSFDNLFGTNPPVQVQSPHTSATVTNEKLNPEAESAQIVQDDDDFDAWVGAASPLQTQQPIPSLHTITRALIVQNTHEQSTPMDDSSADWFDTPPVFTNQVDLPALPSNRAETSSQDTPQRTAQHDDGVDDWFGNSESVPSQSMTVENESTSSVPLPAVDSMAALEEKPDSMDSDSKSYPPLPVSTFEFPDLDNWFSSVPERPVSQPTPTTISYPPSPTSISTLGNGARPHNLSSFHLSIAPPPRPATTVPQFKTSQLSARSPLSQSTTFDDFFGTHESPSKPLPELSTTINSHTLAMGAVQPFPNLAASASIMPPNLAPPQPDSQPAVAPALDDFDDFEDFGTFITSPPLPQIEPSFSPEIPSTSFVPPSIAFSTAGNIAGDDDDFGAWTTDEPQTQEIYQPQLRPPVNSYPHHSAEISQAKTTASTTVPTNIVDTSKSIATVNASTNQNSAGLQWKFDDFDAKSMNASTAVPSNAKLVVSMANASNEAKKGIVDEEAVRRVVQGLPDWSYML